MRREAIDIYDHIDGNELNELSGAHIEAGCASFDRFSFG